MQNKNLNFTAHSVSAKIETDQNLLSFYTATLHLLNGGKIQIIILHGAKAINISIFLNLLTVQIKIICL